MQNGGIGPLCKKAPFRLDFQVIFGFHFRKSNQKVKQEVAEKEPKMATVNDPIEFLQSLPVAIVGVLFMAFFCVVVLFPSTPQTRVDDMNYTVVVFSGVMGLSVVWYYCRGFTGPVANIM